MGILQSSESSSILHKDLTRSIIGCAMQVHSTLKNGCQEIIYQRALAIEFQLNELRFEHEHEMEIYYREKLIGTRRVDFFVENSIVVEIKAVAKLEDVHLAQAMNYLEYYKIPMGILLNFGGRSLEFKRVYYNRLNLE